MGIAAAPSAASSALFVDDRPWTVDTTDCVQALGTYPHHHHPRLIIDVSVRLPQTWGQGSVGGGGGWRRRSLGGATPASLRVPGPIRPPTHPSCPCPLSTSSETGTAHGVGWEGQEAPSKWWVGRPFPFGRDRRATGIDSTGSVAGDFIAAPARVDVGVGFHSTYPPRGPLRVPRCPPSSVDRGRVIASLLLVPYTGSRFFLGLRLQTSHPIPFIQVYNTPSQQLRCSTHCPARLDTHHAREPSPDTLY